MSGTSTKVYTQGTHRVRAPEETWAIIEPLFARFGISRIADVTGLDALGIPVALAVRPLAWTLSVSQGKGQTLELARISAAMESIELWHAERAHPPLAHEGATAAELALPYRIADLAGLSSPFVDEGVRLDWVEGVGLASGTTVPVPRDAVCFRDPRLHQWSPGWIRANSNGLASGNSAEEAQLHALYEVVERDALSRPSAEELERIPRIDPASVADDTCAELVERIAAAGGKVSIQLLPGAFGIPTFRCLLWSWDFPLLCAGFGSHADPVVALSRAVTEAAQTRLAMISGSRDDLEHFHDRLDRRHRKAEYLTAFPEPTADFAEVTAEYTRSFDNTSDELAWLTEGIVRVVGGEPVVVDLSTVPELAVVKVVVPGGRLDVDRVHPEAERAS